MTQAQPVNGNDKGRYNRRTEGGSNSTGELNTCSNGNRDDGGCKNGGDNCGDNSSIDVASTTPTESSLPKSGPKSEPKAEQVLTKKNKSLTGPEMDAQRIPFSKDEEHTILTTGSLMIVAALISFSSGVVATVSALTRGRWLNFFYVVVALLLALWMFWGGRSFRKVAKSDAADQHFLADGFKNLHSVFLLKAIITLLLLVLFALVAALLMLGSAYL